MFSLLLTKPKRKVSILVLVILFSSCLSSSISYNHHAKQQQQEEDKQQTKKGWGSNVHYSDHDDDDQQEQQPQSHQQQQQKSKQQLFQQRKQQQKQQQQSQLLLLPPQQQLQQLQQRQRRQSRQEQKQQRHKQLQEQKQKEKQQQQEQKKQPKEEKAQLDHEEEQKTVPRIRRRKVVEQKEEEKEEEEEEEVIVLQETKNSIVIEPRIVGGSVVPENSNTYSFFVRWDVGCGATVIYPDVLLTAAHCVFNTDWQSTIWVGSTKSSNGIKRSISGISVHPEYNDFNQDYDFMIMILEKPVPTSIHPVQLNANPHHPILGGEPLTAIGFGTTHPNVNAVSERLSEVTIPYVNDTTCYDLYQGQINSETMFCAGADGKDSCQGDSGGPLLDINGTQVGITSWGSGCGDEEFPGIYSRVSHVYDWIQEQICYNSPHRPLHLCGEEDHDDDNDQQQQQQQQQRYQILVEITYDNYPHETGWSIQNNIGQVIVSTPVETMHSLQHRGLISRSVYLFPGNYTFEMIDSAGDGICCGYGSGKFTLRSNHYNANNNNANNNNNNNNNDNNASATRTNDIIVHDGIFDRYVTKYFEITNDGRMVEHDQLLLDPTYHFSNGGGPATVLIDGINTTIQPGDHLLRMEFMYDYFPEEVSWMLVNQITHEMIHYVAYGDIQLSGYDTTTLIVPSGQYYLLLLDSSFDGICCDFGDGWFSFYEIIQGYNRPIASNPGTYTGRVEHFFDLV